MLLSEECFFPSCCLCFLYINFPLSYQVFFNPGLFLLFLLANYRNFVEEKLGVKYTEGRKTEFAKSFRESGPASPVFFILSPGVDPLKDVESLGTVSIVTVNRHRLHALTHTYLLIHFYCFCMDINCSFFTHAMSKE